MHARELANPPLQYLLMRVQQTIQQDGLPQLLPHVIGPPPDNHRVEGPYYVPKTCDELPPITWLLPGIRPLTIDAYDHAAKMYGSSFVGHVPVVGALVDIMVQKQLLHNRHIPLYRDQQQQPAAGANVAGQPQQAALAGLTVEQLQQQLHLLRAEEAEEGNAVRYFYSPGNDGRNLEFLPGRPNARFQSKSFQAFRRWVVNVPREPLSQGRP